MPYLRNRSHLETLAWIIAYLAIVGLALAFDAHEMLDGFFRSHEAYELDEIFTALNVAGALGLVYSVLRLKDLSREASRRLAAEKKIDVAGYHDFLTGLPNRRMLDAEGMRLVKAKSSKDKVAAYSIDLDGLKKINDNLGEIGGDAVIKAVAGRLSELQDDDRVFHLGGDRFLLVAQCGGFSGPQANAHRILQEIGRPILCRGEVVEIAASVGYAICPDDAADLQTLVRSAECAMYVAKKSGKNLAQAFAPSMASTTRRRLQMEADLKSGIRNNAIVPHYQPLVELKTRQIVGYEALARWEVSPGEFVPPCEFIPLAEETGLIIPLTDSLFRRACLDAMDWPADVGLSFNISATQLGDRNLGLKIIKVLGETGLPAHRLEVEVTESAIIHDPETAHLVLSFLDEAGIKIALDDFGTGHSSLSQLSRYPFHKIKIDRSFVASFEHSRKQAKIVKAIIALGTSLGVKITAEGIENESERLKLEELGCDIGQGYLLGRPMAAAALYNNRVLDSHQDTPLALSAATKPMAG